MKNALVLLIVACSVIYFSACKKCYRCLNHCQVCSKQRYDTTLTITFCSDKLSNDYYVQYIDSLTSPSLGWTCHDTANTYNERFCESSTKGSQDVFNKKNAGLYCSPE